ncbi:MAG TPA: DUF3152 domain-containing protein [Thermoleophilaceae bacterium]
MRPAAFAALIALAAIATPASARLPADPSAAGCPEAGAILASASGARLVLAGSELYGCESESDAAQLLDTLPPGVPAEAIAMPRIAGQFAAYSLQQRVRLADVSDGRSITFESAPVALRANRFGRVAWIAQREGGVFEVHRADLAGRDMVLDQGPRIRSTLVVRRGKLRWRDGSRTRSADFDGQRGDRAPLDDAHLRVVPGESAVHGTGLKTWRFAVEVEDGLPIDHAAFARAVEEILFAPIGWLGAGSDLALQRVDKPPFDFRVTLAKPHTVDRLCLPLHTGGRVSCENRGRSVINWLRWSTGSPWWTNQRKYRRYLINHEVGHSLGHPHRYCSRRGAVAPVMQQQTGPANPCIHGFWPKPSERRRSTGPYDPRHSL